MTSSRTYHALQTAGQDMPLGKGVRYRVKTTKRGKRVRLAFRGHKMVEAKSMPHKGEKLRKAMMGE